MKRANDDTEPDSPPAKRPCPETFREQNKDVFDGMLNAMNSAFDTIQDLRITSRAGEDRTELIAAIDRHHVLDNLFELVELALEGKTEIQLMTLDEYERMLVCAGADIRKMVERIVRVEESHVLVRYDYMLSAGDDDGHKTVVVGSARDSRADETTPEPVPPEHAAQLARVNHRYVGQPLAARLVDFWDIDERHLCEEAARLMEPGVGCKGLNIRVDSDKDEHTCRAIVPVPVLLFGRK